MHPAFRSLLLLFTCTSLPSLGFAQISQSVSAGNWQTIGPIIISSTPIWDVFFSPDGRELASISESGTCKIWDMYDGRLLRRSKLLHLFLDRNNNIRGEGHCVLPDGRFAEVRKDQFPNVSVYIYDVFRSEYPQALRGEDAQAILEKACSLDADGARPRFWAQAVADLPRQRVTRHASTPDRKLWAIAGEDAIIRLWDADSGRQIARLSGHTDDIYALAFSPDGRILASGGEDGTALLHRLAPGPGELSPAFPPHSSSSTVRTRHLPLPVPYPHDAGYGRYSKAATKEPLVQEKAALAGSPDSWRLAWLESDGLYLTYSDKEDECHTASKNYYSGLESLTIAHGGSKVLVRHADQSLRLFDVTIESRSANWGWDMRGLRERGRIFPTGTSAASLQAISSDGRMVAWVGERGRIRLWDTVANSTITLPGSAASPIVMAFSPYGDVLAYAEASGMLRRWNRIARSYQPEVRSETPVRHMIFSPNGRRLALAGTDHKIRILDLPTRQIAQTMSGHTGPIEDMDFSRTGRTLVSVGVVGSDPSKTAGIVWDIESGERLCLHPSRTGRALIAGRFSDDGNRIVYFDEWLNYWREPARAPMSWEQTYSSRVSEDGLGNTVFEGAPGPLGPLAFASDGRTIFAATVHGLVHSWDIATGQMISAVASECPRMAAMGIQGTKHPYWGHFFGGCSDGAYYNYRGHGNDHNIPDATAWTYIPPPVDAMAIGKATGEIKFHHANQAGPHLSTGCATAARSLAASPDGKTLVSWNADGYLHYWDIIDVTMNISPRIRDITLRHRGQARTESSPSLLACTNDCALVAYADKDHVLRLVTAADGRDVLLAPAQPGGVAALAFSPDGASLVSAGADPAARLWDVNNMRLKALIKGHRGGLQAASFSPDGRLLALGGDDRVLRLVRMTPPMPGFSPNPNIVLVDTGAASPTADAAPPAVMPQDPEAYAIVIGVERHQEGLLPRADFAARDAQTMHAYLTFALGFPPGNVVLLKDSDASKAELEKHLGSWLRNRATPQSRIMVYYSGHGAPDPETGAPYLVPYDGDPAYLEDTGYPLSRLYANLARLPAQDVRVVLDAGFAGTGARSLLAQGARPLVTVKGANTGVGANIVVITAAGETQASAVYPAGQHGLLTHFLLEGLRGAADLDRDARVQTAELFRYISPLVHTEALNHKIQQTPTITPRLEDLDARTNKVWVRLKGAK